MDSIWKGVKHKLKVWCSALQDRISGDPACFDSNMHYRRKRAMSSMILTRGVIFPFRNANFVLQYR